MFDFLDKTGSIPIDYYLWLSGVLFCIGVMGVLLRRNVIIMLMSIELMLNSVNLLFVAFSTYLGDAKGQVFVFFIIHFYNKIFIVFNTKTSTDNSIIKKNLKG